MHLLPTPAQTGLTVKSSQGLLAALWDRRLAVCSLLQVLWVPLAILSCKLWLRLCRRLPMVPKCWQGKENMVGAHFPALLWHAPSCCILVLKHARLNSPHDMGPSVFSQRCLAWRRQNWPLQQGPCSHMLLIWYKSGTWLSAPGVPKAQNKSQ